MAEKTGLPSCLDDMDGASGRGSLELFAEGGELLLDFGEFAAETGYFFLQVRETIGSSA